METEIKEKKLYTVFSQRIAGQLMARGYSVANIRPDKKNPHFNVFDFYYREELPGLIEELTKK